MKERIAIKIAWLLPKTIVKWCAIRLAAHATTGDYRHTIVPELTVVDALGRWDNEGENTDTNRYRGKPG